MAADNQLSLAFGQALRRARLRAGVTQERLALDSGLDRTFVSSLERGVRQPSLTTLFVLARSLHISPNLLVKRTEAVMLKIARSA